MKRFLTSVIFISILLFTCTPASAWLEKEGSGQKTRTMLKMHAPKMMGADVIYLMESHNIYVITYGKTDHFAVFLGTKQEALANLDRIARYLKPTRNVMYTHFIPDKQGRETEPRDKVYNDKKYICLYSDTARESGARYLSEMYISKSMFKRIRKAIASDKDAGEGLESISYTGRFLN